jgi:large subunit ribosomal protein L9
MRQQLLLLEDVDALGKKGDVVSARSGYVRNFLMPKGLAVVANANMLRKQERLRAEREKQAIIDRKESDELASKIQGITLEINVKVDPEGHMYGSVSAHDIVALFQEKGFVIEKKYIQLTRPIKATGAHQISLKLKEGVPVTCTLAIIPEGVIATGIEKVTAPIPSEAETSQEKETEA